MPKTKKDEAKEPKKKTNVKKVLGIIILFLGVFGLGISFAELADSVQRNGMSYSKSSAKWSVEVVNVSKAELKGEAEVVNDPTANNLGLTEFVVKFAKPGDSVKYTFEMKNDGDIDASVVEFTKGNPTCKNAGDALDSRNDEAKNADSTLVCGNLEYKVAYEDGNDVAAKDTVASKTTKKVVVTVTYKEGSKEATGPVNVTVPALTILFK